MISLIIVNYNTRRMLEQCLVSIRTHCAQAELIVVDNGSRDGSVEMVRENFPEVRLLPQDGNLGFAPANNLGLRVATGDFLVLLNSDTVLEDDGLQRCEAWLQQHPAVGALHPRLIGADDQPQECMYPFPTLGGAVREALRFRSLPTPSAGGWLAGTVLFLRRTALTAIGGELDGRFWMYWEDADLSARLRRAGWELAVFPDACVRHYGGASGGGSDATRRADLHAWYVYGKHRWFAKHRPLWESVCLWGLDAFDVGRKYLRSVLRPSRRGERVHARVMAGVVFGRLFGRSPPIPGQSRSQPTPAPTEGKAAPPAV